MSVSSAASSACTIFSVRALPSAPNVFLDEALAERLAQVVVGDLHAALPARPQLLRAGQRLAVEAKFSLTNGAESSGAARAPACQRR